MHVATQVNGSLYWIAFHSSPDAFEKILLKLGFKDLEVLRLHDFD
jgi:hypothetical protein